MINSSTSTSVVMSPHTMGSNQQQTFFEKMLIGLDHAPPAFNLREQILGPGGANLQYIRNETKAKATLRGRGSNFIDPMLGTESNEPLYLYLEHQRYDGIQAAKQLAKNLIETLQQELIQFQQQQPAQSQASQNISIIQQPAIVQQSSMQNQQITIQQQNSIGQITVPPPQILATVPPPQIHSQQQTLVQTNPTVLHQNFIQQIPPTGVPPPPAQATVIHQQIIPQQATIPIQLQSGNMIIQPPPGGPSAQSAINLPPPNSTAISIPIKTSVQFSQPPPPQLTQLSHPPPTANVQLQNGETQIILNPSQNYQYQYISQQPIQHIYQSPAVQQTNQQLNFQQQLQLTQPQIRQPFATIQQPPVQQQQFITVQGNTAYMVPPPQIVHQPTQQQQIIFQAQQPQIMQIQNIPPPPPPPVPSATQHQLPNSSTDNAESTSNAGNNGEENENEDDDNEAKHDNKEEIDETHEEKDTLDKDHQHQTQHQYSEHMNHIPPNSNISHCVTTTTNSVSAVPTIAIQHIQPQQQIQIRQSPMLLPPTQIPPPTVVQPATSQLTATSIPISCVQHFVGNTLITSNPMLQMNPTQQIYTQVPVTIQHIQQAPQQLHVSTANGQQFVVSTAAPNHQWSQQQTTIQPHLAQVQQIQTTSAIQNVQITPNSSVSNAISSAQVQPLVIPQSSIGMVSSNGQQQVQFATSQNIIQQVPSAAAQIQQSLQQESQGNQILNPTHHHSVNLMHQSQIPNNMNNFQQIGQMTPFQQLKTFSEQHQPRMILGQKRKFNNINNSNEDNGPPNHQQRVGMGQKTIMQLQQQQQNMQPNVQLMNHPPPTQQGGLSISGQDDQKNQQNDGQLQTQQQMENRSFYQRDDPFNLDLPPPPPPPPQQQLQSNRPRQYAPGHMMMIRNPGPRFNNNQIGSNLNQNYQIRQQQYDNNFSSGLSLNRMNFNNSMQQQQQMMQQYRPLGGQGNFGPPQRFSRGGQW